MKVAETGFLMVNRMIGETFKEVEIVTVHTLAILTNTKRLILRRYVMVAGCTQFNPIPRKGEKGGNMTDKTNITVRDIPSDLWWQAKALAAMRQQSIRDLIIDLLRQAVNKEGE